MLPSILFWLIIFPSSCKFHVTDASLTQFNLRSNNTLDYNLKVSITVRNPNNNIIVYYGRITSIAWYKDNDFSWVSLTPFGQCRKNTTFLQAVFEGKSVIKHKSKELGEYKDETSVGIQNDLVVDFDLRIRANYGKYGSSSFNSPIVQCCGLRVPFIFNGKSTPPFGVTKCNTGSFFGLGILFWRRPS